MAEKKKGLGRGLSALLANVEDDTEDTPQPINTPPGDSTIPIDRINANPDQPRRHFSENELNDLANSIGEKGIIQPLILRRDPNNADAYQIVAGERRWRAAQKARLHEVPAIVRDFDDAEVLEVAIVENVQREDLNPIEEANGFQQLMDKFGHTQDKLAKIVGKSRSHIANTLRLLSLPESIVELVETGQLSAGHARAVLSSKEPEALAARIVKEGLSVRQAEAAAKAVGPDKPKSKASQKDADTVSLEGDLSAALGMKVGISHATGGSGGSVRITYKSLDDLDRLCQLLSG